MEMRRLTAEKLFIKLVLHKSLNDPFPIEFGGRSKWDIDLLKRWDAANEMDDKQLNNHLGSMFTFRQLKDQNKKDFSTKFVIDEVREIIKTIFMAAVFKNTYLYAIQDKRKLEKEPDFYLRVHTPLRISPLGAPLLLVSAFDHRMQEKLVEKKVVDSEESQKDFERIFVDPKNPDDVPLRIIYTYTEEEYVMLRYLLRLNSTKMRRTAWQSKNLPRGQR